MYHNTVTGAMAQQAVPMGMFDAPLYQLPSRPPFGAVTVNNSTSNGGDGGAGGNVAVNQGGDSETLPNTGGPPIDLASSDEDVGEEEATDAPAPRVKRKYTKKAAKWSKDGTTVRDAAVAARKKAKASNEDEDDKKARYFSRGDVARLLDLVEEMKPSGGSATWQMLEHRYNADNDEGAPIRTLNSLRNKFKTLYASTPNTGDPNCPPDVRRAKRIKNRIMYDNGVTTVTNGITNGTDTTTAPEKERAFVARSKGDGASSFHDLFMMQQQQSAKRAQEERDRVADERRFERTERLAREAAAERRQEESRKQMMELFGVVASGLGQVLGGNIGSLGGVTPAGRVVAVSNKKKSSLSLRSPDVSDVSSQSSVDLPGAYQTALDVFMFKNYNLDACIDKGRELAVKERSKSWKETFDPNNEDPWHLQGAKAKALSDADSHAERYVRRFFGRRKVKDNRSYAARVQKKKELFRMECRKDAEAIVGLEYNAIVSNNDDNNNHPKRVSIDPKELEKAGNYGKLTGEE
jgi:hypothetical protein